MLSYTGIYFHSSFSLVPDYLGNLGLFYHHITRVTDSLDTHPAPLPEPTSDKNPPSRSKKTKPDEPATAKPNQREGCRTAFAQTSFVIQRNELITQMKDEIEEFYRTHNNKALAPLFHKINMLFNNNLDTEEDWKMFLIKFEEKHTGFFKQLKMLYPQLTANDLKLCACLKLNLDSKSYRSTNEYFRTCSGKQPLPVEKEN